jgi:hypothetical protein
LRIDRAAESEPADYRIGMLADEVDVEEPREDKARFQRTALIRICECNMRDFEKGLMFSRVDTRRSV